MWGPRARLKVYSRLGDCVAAFGHSYPRFIGVCIRRSLLSSRLGGSLDPSKDHCSQGVLTPDYYSVVPSVKSNIF